MKKLILYDLDGTIVDTRRDIIEAVRFTLANLNAPEMTDEEIKKCVGTGLHSLIRQVLKTDDEKLLERAAKLYRKFYEAHMLDNTALYPSVIETLEYFKTRTQAVITNKPNPFSTQILDSLGILKYFAGVFAGDQGFAFKPDPAAIKYMREKANAAKDETIFIGDSEVDIQTAGNADVEAVIVAHGFARAETLEKLKPNYLVKDFQEFLALAKKMNW